MPKTQLDLFSPSIDASPPDIPSDYLRPYQQQAVDAALEALAAEKNPVIALPTGSGKTRVIAALCQSLEGRILVATHRKELLQQNSEELATILDGEHGIYSAGLSRREADARIIFGGITSIYRRMEELQQAGPFSTIIVDEAHLCAPKASEGTMYAQVFASCPQAQRVGLTATPYRLQGGPIWGQNDDTFFDALACNVSIRLLTPLYLSPLRGILTAHDIDLTGVRTQAGEYVLSDMSQVACEENVVDAALNELCSLAKNRHHWLVFCIDVAHTEIVTEKLQARGIKVGMIVGTTKDEERDETLQQFKAGELQALVGCLVFTTGFNLPNVDLIACIRPTQSKSLFIQMIGRGSRQSLGKIDACIIDYGGNIERHQPLDDVLAEIQKSPARQAKDEAEEKKREAARKRREAYHDGRASLADPFGNGGDKRQTQRVLGIGYALEHSKKYPGKTNIVATYRLSGTEKWCRAWICLEYPGGARWHAEQYFKRRGEPMPETAEEGIRQLRRISPPVSVVVERGGKYPRVVVEHFE